MRLQTFSSASIVTALLGLARTDAFQVTLGPILARRSPGALCAAGSGAGRSPSRSSTTACAAAGGERHGEPDGADDPAPPQNVGETARRRRAVLPRLVAKTRLAVARWAPAVVASLSLLSGAAVPPARAGAPVMAIPKMKAQDPVQNAFDQHDRELMREAQLELQGQTAKARQIEQEQGPEARERFEREYQEAQKAKSRAYEDGLKQLKYDLLDEGIVPSMDIEGRRQMILYQKGVDLSTVGGTPFYAEKMYKEKEPEKSFAYKKKANREIVKYMVQDLKGRGLDPLDYFDKRQDKAELVLGLPPAKAIPLAEQYARNMDLYGQIAPPKEGEKSVKELMAEKGKKGNKEEEKRLKAEAKAKAASEKAEAKAKAKEEKARAQEEARAAKEAAEREKQANKAAAAAAAAATTPSPLGGLDVASPYSIGQDSGGGETAVVISQDDVDPSVDGGSSVVATLDEEAPVDVARSKSGGVNVISVSAALLAVGGGALAAKTLVDRSAAAEAERQRQFKLLMGGMGKDTESSAASGSSVGSTLSDLMFEYENLTENDDGAPDPLDAPAPKKKRTGLKSFFRKNRNDRETDINALVAPGASSPEFAKTLAKILTLGAPGRFPEVMALPGGMPLEVFDFEAANEALKKAQEDAGLSREESAEIFANVVNCMLIDIVDLASTSLKEKDDTVTVNAVNIVVDYMEHAASLFNSIAEGVTLEPVTYGGDVSKSNLEQMYCAYALSAMSDMTTGDEKTEDKLSLLQSVFQLNEKKVEGMMMKGFQKKMMDMMKNGIMPEGMEEMMKQMQDAGLGDLTGEGDVSPAQLKQMLLYLKDLKESGTLSGEEMAEMQKQFRAVYGDQFQELMKEVENGEELPPEDSELFDLMKSLID